MKDKIMPPLVLTIICIVVSGLLVLAYNAISVISVIFMCPLMSLASTLLFKDAGREVIAVWLETTAMNFPMALCWQLFFAGPIVRFVFGLIFREREQKSGAVSAAAE